MAVYSVPTNTKPGWFFIQHCANVPASLDQWSMAPFKANTAFEQYQAAHIIILELMRFFSMMENDSYYDQALNYTNNFSSVGAQNRLIHKNTGWKQLIDNFAPVGGSDFDWEAPQNPPLWAGESFEILVGVTNSNDGVFITYAQQKSSIYTYPSMAVSVNTSASSNGGFGSGSAMPNPTSLATPQPYVKPVNTVTAFTVSKPLIIPVLSMFSVNERQS